MSGFKGTKFCCCFLLFSLLYSNFCVFFFFSLFFSCFDCGDFFFFLSESFLVWDWLNPALVRYFLKYSLCSKVIFPKNVCALRCLWASLLVPPTFFLVAPFNGEWRGPESWFTDSPSLKTFAGVETYQGAGDICFPVPLLEDPSPPFWHYFHRRTQQHFPLQWKDRNYEEYWRRF